MIYGFPGPTITSPYHQATICDRNQTAASGTWPVANAALYFPLRLERTFIVANIFWVNGATVLNTYHFDAGLYTPGGVRLASTGSTAQGTATSVQSVALAVTLPPGLYYLALACDTTSATVHRLAHSISSNRASGALYQASAFVLPASATFATYAANYTPVIGISSRSVV